MMQWLGLRRIGRSRQLVQDIGYRKSDEPAGKNTRSPESTLELANLGRVLDCRGDDSWLLRAFLKISNYAKRTLAELADVCCGGVAVVGGRPKGFRKTGTVPRKDRGANICRAKFGGGSPFRICNPVCFATIATFRGRAKDWDQSAGIYTSRHERENSCTVHAAFRANAWNGRIGSEATRSASSLLPRVLVTILQLRVTGYRRKFE